MPVLRSPLLGALAWTVVLFLGGPASAGLLQTIGEQADGGVPIAGHGLGAYTEDGTNYTQNCVALGPETTQCTLPFELGPGDLIILEPGGVVSDRSTWSDVLRTESTQEEATLTLFSDMDGDPTYFDDFILQTENVSIFESGPPTIYNAGPAMQPFPDGNSYHIYSDVPEPSALVLAAAGLLGLWVPRRRARFRDGLR